MKNIYKKVDNLPNYITRAIEEKNIPYLEQIRVKEYSEKIPPLEGKRRAIIPWSGGLDSTACVLMAIESGLNIITVNFNYGQEYYEKEKARIEKLKADISMKKGVSWERHYEIDMSSFINTVSASFEGSWEHIFPFRNYFILMECAKLDVVKPYDEIWFGCVQGEIPYSGGDKSSIFLNHMRYLFGKKEIQLVTPLIALNKSDILLWAFANLENRYKYIKETISCFSGDGEKHCGRCQSCFNRAVAFNYIGRIEDCGYEINKKDILPFVKSYKKKLGTYSHYSLARREQLVKFINYIELI